MERTLILQTAQGETVTEAEVCCFARQLLKDLKSDTPKIKWAREKNAPWGAFVSTGITGTSIIRLSTYQHLKHPVIYMSYQTKDRFIYTLQEFDGNPENPKHLAHLYKWVSASVKHSDIYGNVADKSTDPQLSVGETKDRCLKVIDVFRAVTVQEILDKLMAQPSMVSFDISKDSPEWQRRSQQVKNIVQLIQCARIKESPLILDGFALKKADGTLYGHIATEPIAKWANAHVIVRKDRYEGLAYHEIRVKIAADIIASLLLIL